MQAGSSIVFSYPARFHLPIRGKRTVCNRQSSRPANATGESIVDSQDGRREPVHLADGEGAAVMLSFDDDEIVGGFVLVVVQPLAGVDRL